MVTSSSPPPPLARSRVPAFGRFGPVAFSVATLAAVSIGMLAWSHQGWHALQEREHTFDALLSSAQLQARRSQWLTDQRLQGREDVSLAAIDDLSRQAQQSARALQDLAPPDLQTHLRRLTELIRQAHQVQQDLLRERTDAQIEHLHQTLSELEATADQAAQVWAQARAADIQTQRRLDQLNMLLVGGLTLLLLALMARAHRQRAHAALALRAREAQLQAFADSLPDLAFHMDAQGRYLDIYGHNQRLLGRPADQLLGRSLKDLFPPDMAERFMGTLRLTLESRQPQSIAFSVPILGEMRYFESRCAPVSDTNQVVWMAWDVSSRRDVERRLRHKTRMYDFLSHVNQTIVRSDTRDTLFERVCQVAVQHGQFRKAWVALFDTDGRQLRHQIVAGDPALPESVLDFALPSEAAQPGTLYRSLQDGQVFRTRDLSDQPNPPDWARQTAAHGVPGCVVLPLREDARLIGHLILLGRRVKDQDPEE
ncbi:MAG TPA: PAS domain-containing protein, partial [Aquabacterium sp.]|nr:PAS domain-containing protein [Aquabacterium sp.]